MGHTHFFTMIQFISFIALLQLLSFYFQFTTIFYLSSILLLLTFSFLIYRQISSSQREIDQIATIFNPLPKNGKKVAIIGGGLSGIQALKEAYAQGWEPIVFEQSDKLGGVWQFDDKKDESQPSVYKSTHIDTGRDLNSFGDFMVPQSEPIIMHNKSVAKYLNQNVDRFNLRTKIRFNTKVKFISPIENKNETVKWSVSSTSNSREKNETFDAVLICTGRHSNAFTPKFKGMEKFKGTFLHSAQYKSPESHELKNKNVVVIGIGNSGSDIACELSMVAKSVHLVSRSGGYVFDLKKVPLTSLGQGGRIATIISDSIPWRWKEKAVQNIIKSGAFGNQTALFDAGLQPKHGFLQAHPTGTGLHGPNFIECVEKGKIKIHRNLSEIKANSVIFEENEKPIEIDVIISATGYKSGIDFLDTNVVDLRVDRSDNKVPLYLGMFVPQKRFQSLCFINFVQSASFLCADLQTRLFFQLAKGAAKLPNGDEQRKIIIATDKTLGDQYLDRPRHRVQHGLNVNYYEELAAFIGCQPTLSRLLVERPEALWHGLFSPVCGLVYRLVGPGKTKDSLNELIKRDEDLRLGHLQQRLLTPPLIAPVIPATLALIVAKLMGHSVSLKTHDPKYIPN